MKIISNHKWAYSLSLSLFFIIIGTLVRYDVLSIDTFTEKERIENHSRDTSTVSSEKLQVPIRNLPTDTKINDTAATSSENSSNSPESPISRLKTEFARKLVESGFNSHEADQSIEIITSTFKENEGKGIDSITLGIERAAKALNLDASRQAVLRSALFESFNETGGSFTIDDFQRCVAKRVLILSPNRCATELLDRFVEEIATSAETHERITLRMQKEYSAIQDRYVKLSQTCKIDQVQAERLFAPMLSDCPR